MFCLVQAGHTCAAELISGLDIEQGPEAQHCKEEPQIIENGGSHHEQWDDILLVPLSQWNTGKI